MLQRVWLSRRVNNRTAAVLRVIPSAWCLATLAKANVDLASKDEEASLVHRELQITKATLRDICSQSSQLLKLRKGIFMDPSLGEPFLSNMETIKELGLPYSSEKQLILEIPDLLMRGSPADLKKTVKWFTHKLGLDRRRFGKLVVECPWLIKMSIEEDVVPVWGKFEEAGIDKKGFKNVVMHHPDVLRLDLATNSPLKMVQDLRESGLSKKDAQTVLVRAPGILSGCFQETITPVLKRLKAVNLTDQDALVVLVEAPEFLIGDASETLRSKLEWLVRKVGIHKSRVHKLVLAAPTVFCRYELSTLEEGYSTLLSCGYSKQECCQIVSARPGLLCLERMEIRQKVWFWVKILKCNPRDIVKFPAYLGAPFRERVLFRIAFLDWKGIDIFSIPLNVMFTKQDTVFFTQFGRHNISTFRTWWRQLSLPEMIFALKHHKYLNNPNTEENAANKKLNVDATTSQKAS